MFAGGGRARTASGRAADGPFVGFGVHALARQGLRTTPRLRDLRERLYQVHQAVGDISSMAPGTSFAGTLNICLRV
jgi:hypothetical protein